MIFLAQKYFMAATFKENNIHRPEWHLVWIHMYSLKLEYIYFLLLRLYQSLHVCSKNLYFLTYVKLPLLSVVAVRSLSCVDSLPPHCSPPGCSSVKLFQQEFWSVLPFPFPGYLPDSSIKPMSPTLTDGFFTTKPPGKPKITIFFLIFKALNLNIFSSQNLLVTGFSTKDMARNQTGHLCDCIVDFLLGTE